MKRLFCEKHLTDKDVFIKIMKKPKQKPYSKIRINEELNYFVMENGYIYTFVKRHCNENKDICASCFNIESVKEAHYLELCRAYDNALNKFNREDFAHSPHITSCIIDEIYKYVEEVK